MTDRDSDGPADDGGGEHRKRSNGRSSKVSALTVSRRAMSQLAELVGRQPDSVSMLTTDEDGWRLRVEVVELDRVPQTTSVLATYEVQTDRSGDVLSYRRINRYTRNQAGEL
ncbi:MAG: gas vesicle protein [Actinocatenispora sp.]